MPIIDYPFLRRGRISRPSPLLPLQVISPGNGFGFFTWGLIDTGADVSIIPEWLGTQLGHDFTAGYRDDVRTAGGSAEAFEHTFRIEIFGLEPDGTVLPNVVATVTDQLISVMQEAPWVCLGVDDFLKDYILTVNYPEQIFSVQLPTA